VITLSALYVYPVKSCRGTELGEALLTETGLAHDREWMIATPEGRFLTQRELPRLALIAPRLATDALWLEAPGHVPLQVPLEFEGPQVEVVVWGDRCLARDQGEAAARWLGAFLGRKARLVRFDPARHRYSDPEWTGGMAAVTRFSDGYALMAIARASLDDLNARLPAPLPVERFRPNVVLDGLPPYGEDDLRDLWIGDDVHWRVVKPCKRCVVTTTNQQTGEVEGDEPLRTLRAYRWDPQLHAVTFGQNVIVIAGAGATLTRGDAVHTRATGH
jgi:hypothetical protein